MDSAPIPPHERPWRHPSELGAPAHEPTSNVGRALIVTTATLSLLLVGLLAVSMTPERSAAPEAVSSSVSPVRVEPVTLVSTTETRVSLPMITPVGDDGLAVTTAGAIGAEATMLTARLPSGIVVEARVLSADNDDGLAVVALPDSVQDAGLGLADADPVPSDTVLVHAEEPMVVAVRDLPGIDVDEGTPVTDGDGNLVGVCTNGDRTALMSVSTVPAVAPDVDADRSPSVPTVADTATVATTAPEAPPEETAPSTARPATTTTTESSSTTVTTVSPTTNPEPTTTMVGVGGAVSVGDAANGGAD